MRANPHSGSDVREFPALIGILASCLVRISPIHSMSFDTSKFV